MVGSTHGLFPTLCGSFHRRFPLRMERNSGSFRGERGLGVSSARTAHPAQITGRTVLVRSDNMTVVAYLNRQCGPKSPALHWRTAEILLWADSHLASLRACHVPEVLNVGAAEYLEEVHCTTSRAFPPPILAQVWHRFGHPMADLFASAENAQCPLWFSLRSSDIEDSCMLFHQFASSQPYFAG